jgi:hypothetical protein
MEGTHQKCQKKQSLIFHGGMVFMFG